MNKQDLVNAIAEHHSNTGTSKVAIGFVLDALGDVVQGALKKGDEVTVPGICKISSTLRAGRTGKNPRTGEALEIPAKHVPKIVVLKALKDAAAVEL
jgi:DNA-binding protein HU-beta